MKIVDVVTQVLKAPEYPHGGWVLVRVRTDDGVEGIGECFVPVDLLQPDLSWVGGLTEGKRIAELGRLFRVPVVPHNWGTMVNLAASVQLVAAMPDGFLCEYPITSRIWSTEKVRESSPMMTELATRGIVVEDGHARVPEDPGLGIELDEEAVERYRCDR